MKLLFDIGHPAHVHLFRNLIKKVLRNGGSVLAATREKDVTTDLCQFYDIPQSIISKVYSGNPLSGFNEFLTRTIRLYLLARTFRPDALLGTSTSIGIVGHLINRPSFIFEEDDAEVIPPIANYVYPTCTYVVTPDCLRHENYGEKHLTYKGYHELAYLHPDHFKPDPDIARSIGLDPHSLYFILRFVALKAHHDTGAIGLSEKHIKDLIKILSPRGRILITSEGQLHDDFKKYQFPLEPEKLLDVLAFASLYIGDSQTVAAEAAVLGIPNFRCNSFVGRLSYLEELETLYGLTKGYKPEKSDILLTRLKSWILNIEKTKQDMQNKRRLMLDSCVNVSDWQYNMLLNKLKVPPHDSNHAR